MAQVMSLVLNHHKTRPTKNTFSSRWRKQGAVMYDNKYEEWCKQKAKGNTKLYLMKMTVVYLRKDLRNAGLSRLRAK